VGDWIVLEMAARPTDSPTVACILPRRTAIVRRAAGLDPQGQVLATNVDTVLVLVATNGRVTPRSVERYLTLVWESGATPVVVLTKTDLVSTEELDAAVAELQPACVGVALHSISTQLDEGLAALDQYLVAGATVALLGPSGAGKSTLVNRLTGSDLVTGDVRSDGRGRHTTSYRELIPLPVGGVLIDTPGLREVGLWQSDEGIAKAFPEITALFEPEEPGGVARHPCRFTDCSHTNEPGCALLAAVADGRVGQDRLVSWQKLHRELDRLAAQEDPALAAARRAEERRLFRGSAQARKQPKKPR
jgi:ribosome biogenesis GTPase